MIQTKIENNFFSYENINNLKKYVYNELNKREKIKLSNDINVDTNIAIIQDHVGRLVMHFNLHKIPEEIYQVTYEYALSLNKDCVPYSFIFSRYSKKYGEPKLLPHIDNAHTDFTIDYQIESNIDWSIYVENNKYLLKDNDALLFASSDLMHWREPRIFKEDEYVDMIFFHFVHKDKKMIHKKPATIKGDYIFEYYKKVKNL
jgi:hypothetical protein